MAENYEIRLGIDLDTSDLQTKINSAGEKANPIPIKVEIENLAEIKKQLQSLGGTKNNAKVAIPIDTASLETSLKDVSTTIKEIRSSIGTLDSKSGMKSLLSSINQISNALEKASNQFESLNANLNALSGKDLSLNFGINLGGSNPIGRNAAYGSKVRNDTLPQLKEQMNALVKYYNDTYKTAFSEFEALQKMVSGTKLGTGDFFETFLFGKDSVASRMNGGSLASQMQAYKQYIDMFKQAASLRGLDISSVTSGFSKSADQLIRDAQDVQTGAKEMEDSFEKLKQVFGGGNNINIEGISAQLDSIVLDLGEIKTALQGLSSGVSLGGLTQSFDRLSETLEKIVSNAALVRTALGEGLTNATSFNSGSIDKIGKTSDDTTAAVIQNEKKKQEAYKATADTVLYHAGVISKLNKAETNGRFYGSNRGTGYFGTGHYFVDSATKHELDNDSYYNGLPYTSIDISQYDNLFKATSDEVASKLHNFLQNLTRYTQGSDSYDVSDLFAQFKSVFGDTIMDVKEFGSRLDQLKTFMTNSSLRDRSDSVSTQFMKSLGYGGVDTRGTSYADTRYGTVIYDLKEESILQANITDELQKQGQMLEKINYEKGQVFDKDADARIKQQLDEQAKRKEIADEFTNSFDTTNLDKATSDLDKAKNRLREINDVIEDLQYSIDNAEKEAQKFARDMEEFGLGVTDKDIEEHKKFIEEDFQKSIDQLSQEREELQSKIPVLEDTYNRESQLAQEAYEQAKQTVEQRHLEAQEDANEVVQAEERKRQAYKETADIVENDLKQATVTAGSTSDAIRQMQDVMSSMKFDHSSIDAVAKDLEELGIEISKITVKDNGANLDVTVKGIDTVGRAVTEIRRLDKASDEISPISKAFTQSFETSADAAKRLEEETATSFKKLKSLAKDMGKVELEISGLEANGEIEKANSLKRVLNDLESEFKELYSITEKNLSLDQVKELDGIFANTTGEVREFKNELAKSAEAKELTSGLERLKSITKEIASLRIDIFKFEDVDNIERASNRLNELENEAAELRATLQQKFNVTSFDEIDDVARKGEEALDALITKAAEAKAKLANDIKLDIDYGTYDNQISQMDDKLNRLSFESDELRESVEQVRKAYAQMELALEGTGDEVADRERLIQAEKDYARALEKTNNLIRIQAREEKALDNAEKLADKKAALKLDMANYLKDNSRAANEFGDEIKRLSSLLDSLDDVGVNNISRKFKNLTREIKNAGKDGLTVFDQFKKKAKEYASYLSAAEVFMWIEQGLREMFNTVKEIDTAMTGLYRVTDLTASQYDTLFNNMISSAKEYGATLNDIINATTDWVRAGFDADVALGMAEVTTMYQHISDLDYDTASENLITAYNGFKNELLGLYDGDEVAAVQYIADIFNELDNNFAITSAGLGEALKRSASALDLAGNSIQETAGMVTGIAEVTQDPEKAGNALKVLSLRLRGMKGSLEEMGEEVDDNVENISKMQGQILNMTGGKVNIFDNLGNFKSTYEIMQGIAQVWDDLSSVDQADLLETIAGKHRANDVAALLSNWKNVEAAVKSASEAEGSAATENAKYIDSIQGRLDKLTTAWQSFANTFMESDFLKGAISGLTGLVELVEKLVDNIGTLGTIGLGVGIFGLFKNFKNIKPLFSLFSALPSELRSVKGLFQDFGKTFLSTASGIASGIGIAIAAIGLITSAIKNYYEEQARLRQEAIQTADTFLDSASSFEQAYIKYSGRTDLTTEEEAELESAIKGTVDALGDKSSALQSVVNSSNDYVASLEAIKNAELKAARDAAENKKKNAALELKEAAIGWESFDGSEVDVSAHNAEAIEIFKSIGKDYYTVTENARGEVTYKGLKLDGYADTKEIIDYYYTLLDIQAELTEGTAEYNRISSVIGKMSEAIGVYTDGVYEAAKANYQLSEGIPKTAEEYFKMREVILGNSDMKDLSLNTKLDVINTLDSEYGQIFDLTTAEAQARKLVGVFDKYGDKEAKQVETFLNMKTAVNNGECTVGEYLSEFEKINTMTDEWSDEEKEIFDTSFGLDVDSVKKQYDKIHGYLVDKLDDTIAGQRGAGVYKEELSNEIKRFLDGLSADELSAVVSIRSEIDWENTSADDIRKQIENQAKINRALNFQADIEIDKTSLESFNTALEESSSAMGLTTESINSLKSKYSELDSYDSATLFEKTANGVKVNREEVAKLEKEYNDLTKTEVQEHIDTLTQAYNDNVVAIDECTNAAERAELISDNEAYKNKIEELSQYQAQLEGVTGAYQRWIDAQNAPEDYEGYELVATSREDIEDEIDRGFISNASKEYIDLLSGEDLQGGTIDDYANAWGKLDDKITGAGHSINDFFTVNDDGDITATGIDRFFKSVQTDFKGSIAKFNEETGQWEYNFSQENLQKIQDEWGLGIEAIELLLEAAGAAGYDVDWDGLLDNIDLDTAEFETLVSYAESAQSELNKLKGYENLKFNFTTTNVVDATTEFERARKAYVDLITNDDGTVNLEAEGAEEMRVILSTLLVQKQQLSTPAIMKVDTSQIDQAETDVIDVIQKAQALQKAYENYEIAISTGIDVEGAKDDLNTAIDGMKGTSVDVRADLKLPTDDELQTAKDSIGDIKVGATLDGTAIGDLETKIQTECTPEVIAKVTGLNEEAIQNGSQKVVYTADHKDVDAFINSLSDISKKIIYTYTTEGTKPNPKNIERTITYKYETEGTGPAAGTAHANGSASGHAFVRGNWGIKGSGTALGGELGQEIVVRDGRFFTIGDSGAEFFRYKKNDIIFNAAQTESLFKYGGIKGAKPRGTMLAGGTAFAEGKAFNWSATGTTSNFANSRKNSRKNESEKNAKTETKTTTKDNSVTTTTTTSWSANAKGSNFSSNRESNREPDSSSTKTEKEFEETIDFVEIAISRIEREIDNLDKKVNNTYKSWSERNNSLASEIDKVSEEITLQQSAAQEYLKKANQVGLGENYAKKIRNGSLTIEDFKGESNEKLVEKIKDYQKWYELYLKCTDAAVELREEESKLYDQRFENIQTQYDAILQGYEHTETMLNEYISQAEEQGYIISKKYYEALIDNEKSNINELKKEQADLIAERDNAVAEGKIIKGSEAWYEQCAAIDEVTQEIEEGTTALIEYNNAIRDIDWEAFDLIQQRISDITTESEFLIELMSNKKLFDDNGKFTEQGVATLGLHALNYNTSMYQSDEYAKEIAEIDEQLAKGYDKNLEERRRELVESRYDAILAAESEKNAIKDLVEEGISVELDALQELIDKKNEALESEKDLYEYQKKVKEQTKEIAALEKQMAAFSGDDSEEAQQKIQQIKVDLESARQDLEETEYDKFISDSAALLDELYLEYETILNTRLDNIDDLLQQVIDGINIAAGADGTITSALGSEGALALAIGANATTIGQTLKTETDKVGTTLSTAMNNIWSVGEGNAKSVLTTYGEGFQSKQTTTNTELSSIKSGVNSLVSAANKEAEKKVTANKTTTSAVKNPTTTSTNKTTTTQTNANKSTSSGGDGKAKVGDKVKFVSGQYYYDSQGKKPLGYHNRGKEVYITSINNASWATHPYHISTGNKLGKGDLGWLKLNQLSGYAIGKQNFAKDELAWTQEKGREFIVRPSDGAILTPLAKKDSVLNANASNNIWDMANSPAEFIKDNLNLGVASAPNNSNVNNSITQNFENITFSMPNVHGYNDLLTEMQRDPKFEKLILSMTIDQIAGKSKLAKGKSIR